MYKISPSDFAYLWEDCRHCYYQKVKNKITYSGVFPSMFGRINSLLQTSIMNMDLNDVHPSLPHGIIDVQEGYLRSKLIPSAPDCYISGRFDIRTRLDDGTYSIVDFKITTPNEEKIQKYAMQLHAYKFALENPAFGEPINISKLGVVSINPDDMKLKNGKIVFTASPTWHPFEINMDKFYSLVSEISGVLNGPLPESSPNCGLCTYRGYFANKKVEVLEDIPF